jgi:hypothetical protein
MDEIADDELLLRHIPGGTLWQAPGPRITSANFQLRHDRNETGVSVTRLRNVRMIQRRPGRNYRHGSIEGNTFLT